MIRLKIFYFSCLFALLEECEGEDLMGVLSLRETLLIFYITNI